jgi:hypothetical protein
MDYNNETQNPEKPILQKGHRMTFRSVWSNKSELAQGSSSEIADPMNTSRPI